MTRRATSVGSIVIYAGALLFLFGSAAPALAQVPSPAAPVRVAGEARWEGDVHAGGAFGKAPTGGSPFGAFPGGDGFTTAGSRPSRYASIWYFGDGAALLN